MIPVKVGEKIPLTLQVYDGNPDLQVKCTLMDKYGAVFMNVKLDHISSGLYVNNSMEMPEMDFLIGQYLTNRPMDYEIAQDIFQGIPKVQMPEKYVVGEVIDTVELTEQDSLIIGEVQDDNEEV